MSNKNLYQSILAKGKDALKVISDIVAERKDKRAFKSAYDNALEKRDKAMQEQSKLYENIGEYASKMPEIIRYSFEIREQGIAMEMILKEYKTLFGSDMKIEEQD